MVRGLGNDNLKLMLHITNLLLFTEYRKINKIIFKVFFTRTEFLCCVYEFISDVDYWREMVVLGDGT